MKKEYLTILLSLILLSIFLIPLLKAVENPPMPPDPVATPDNPATTTDTGTPSGTPSPDIGEVDPATGLPKTVKTVQDIGDAATSEDPADYLKKEWGKIISKNEHFKSIVDFYSKIDPYLRPFSKYTIGMEPELSFMYFLTFGIWLTIVIFLYRGLSIYSNSSRLTMFAIALIITIVVSMQLINGKVLALLLLTGGLTALLMIANVKSGLAIILSLFVSLMITAVMSAAEIMNFLESFKITQFLGIPKFLATLIIGAISKFLTTWWMQFIIYVIVIFALLIAIIFSKQIEDTIRGIREKNKRRQYDLEQEKFKQNAEMVDELAKTMLKKK